MPRVVLLALCFLPACLRVSTPSPISRNFDGCVATTEREVVTLACPGDLSCTVQQFRQTPEALLDATIADSDVSLVRVDETSAEEPGDGVRHRVSVRGVRLWPVSEVVSCTSHAEDPRFEALRSGLPDLRGIVQPWVEVTWEGRTLTVPRGCCGSRVEGGGRIRCGLDVLSLSTVDEPADYILEQADLAVGELGPDGPRRAWVRHPACRLDGRPAACALQTNKIDPMVSPYFLTAVNESTESSRVARCSWTGLVTELPPVCAQVLRVRAGSL